MGGIIYKCVGGWGLGGLHCIVNLLVKRIWYQTHWWKLTARDANLQIMTLKFHWKFLLFSAVFMYSIVILPGTGETDTILRQTITKNNKRLVSGSLHSPTAGTIWKCFCSLLCLSGDIHRTVYFFFLLLLFTAPPLPGFLCRRYFSWVFKGGFLSSLDMHTLFPRRWPCGSEKKPSLVFVCCVAGNKGAGAELEGPA